MVYSGDKLTDMKEIVEDAVLKDDLCRQTRKLLVVIDDPKVEDERDV